MNTPRRNVLITGASSGIGAACVAVFANAGYDIVLAARRLDKLNESVEKFKRQFPQQKFIAVECDVTSDSAVKKLFQIITQEFGFLCVLVNNAGYGVYGSVDETPVESFRQNMDTNYLGVIRCTQNALPLLRGAFSKFDKRPYPAIIMVSSIVGRRSMPKLASYCASKFALEALSESLRLELWDEKISVSVINPGVTKTEFAGSAKGQRPAAFLSAESAMPSKTVAEKILRAVKHPTRNVYLTLAGKAGIVLQWLSPRLFDRILLKRTR
jgi:short-subunit dehydrogenase